MSGAKYRAAPCTARRWVRAGARHSSDVSIAALVGQRPAARAVCTAVRQRPARHVSYALITTLPSAPARKLVRLAILVDPARTPATRRARHDAARVQVVMTVPNIAGACYRRKCLSTTGSARASADGLMPDDDIRSTCTGARAVMTRFRARSLVVLRSSLSGGLRSARLTCVIACSAPPIRRSLADDRVYNEPFRVATATPARASCVRPRRHPLAASVLIWHSAHAICRQRRCR